jgi:pimeloyl-ACP methyl ester carboxylesterase
MAANLVFASGVLAPQRIAGLDYVNGLSSQYPADTTLFSPVSVLGSVELRAQELATEVNARFPRGEVHIIAHSMGGLDARCLLAHVYIESREGANDGMVSVNSATWPNELEEAAWNADHFAEVGYDFGVPGLATPFPFLGTIARVVQRAIT